MLKGAWAPQSISCQYLSEMPVTRSVPRRCVFPGPEWWRSTSSLACCLSCLRKPGKFSPLPSCEPGPVSVILQLSVFVKLTQVFPVQRNSLTWLWLPGFATCVETTSGNLKILLNLLIWCFQAKARCSLHAGNGSHQRLGTFLVPSCFHPHEEGGDSCLPVASQAVATRPPLTPGCAVSWMPAWELLCQRRMDGGQPCVPYSRWYSLSPNPDHTWLQADIMGCFPPSAGIKGWEPDGLFCNLVTVMTPLQELPVLLYCASSFPEILQENLYCV